MNDIKELDNDELEKVVGGADIVLTFKSLDIGDVFVSKTSNKDGIIITEHVDITDNETIVKYRKIWKNSSGWIHAGMNSSTEKFGNILNMFSYSFEYSGKTGL